MDHPGKPTENKWEGTFRSEHTPDGKIKLIPDPHGKIRAGGGVMNSPPPASPIITKTNMPSNTIFEDAQ